MQHSSSTIDSGSSANAHLNVFSDNEKISAVERKLRRGKFSIVIFLILLKLNDSI